MQLVVMKIIITSRVQNKQELTPDVQQNLSRQYDTLTVAKYPVDPVGYGLP